MMKNISHVKNPLTIIAVFAGLAEVSGTAVLPLLTLEIQKTYVWFLMGFPLSLVAIFFLTLWYRHYVLYAPSDFRDDKIFAGFVQGSGSVRTQKLNEETEIASAELSADSSTITSTLDEGQLSLAEPTQDTTGPALTVDETANTERRITSGEPTELSRKRELTAKILLAEELAVTKLSNDLQVQFVRNVTPSSRPDLMFDAVASSPELLIVAEVKYSRHGMLPRQLLNRQFERVQMLFDSLTSNQKRNFLFILAIATEQQDKAKINGMRIAIEQAALKHPYRTRVEYFHLSELECVIG